MTIYIFTGELPAHVGGLSHGVNAAVHVAPGSDRPAVTEGEAVVIYPGELLDTPVWDDEDSEHPARPSFLVTEDELADIPDEDRPAHLRSDYVPPAPPTPAEPAKKTSRSKKSTESSPAEAVVTAPGTGDAPAPSVSPETPSPETGAQSVDPETGDEPGDLDEDPEAGGTGDDDEIEE